MAYRNLRDDRRRKGLATMLKEENKAKLRSEVAWDRYHTVCYYPKAEIGTRLMK